MAEGGIGIQLGGHDYEFVPPVPDKWICPICYLPLKDPVQVVGCGHRFCGLCMVEILKTPFPKCPTDRKIIVGPEGARVFVDIGCNREIQDLGIKCPNETCSWTGKLRAVEIHLLSCRKAPTKCVNDCGAKDIPREEMKKHLAESCSNRMQACDFNFMGCQEMIPLKDLQKHMESNMRSHLLLACKKIAYLEDAIKHQGESIDNLFILIEEAEADIREVRGEPIPEEPQP